MSFWDRFYDFLDRIGYLHPIHPAMTHMPIGLAIGAFFLMAFAFLPRFRALLGATYPVLVVALLFVFPTILFGFMDWERYYAGAWLFPIKMKMILAGALFTILLIGVMFGRHRPHVLMPVIVFSFFTAGALGYFGGQLVYGGAAPQGPAKYRAGQKVFDNNCTGCHAHGGNVIRPNLPLRSAPQLASQTEFRNFLRNPRLPNGAVGPMPRFSPSRLSDQQIEALYQYVVHVLAHPKRQ